MRSLQLFTAAWLLPAAWAATFPSCTDSQIATLQIAIERATNKSLAVIEHLEDNPNGSDLQTTWYGAFDAGRYNRTLAGFKKFAPDLATTFSYSCTCISDAAVATTGNTYGDVEICTLYFNEALVPPTGHRSQWDTLVHEATHFADTMHTVDWGYGVDLCKQLALEDPEKAVSNAE